MKNKFIRNSFIVLLASAGILNAQSGLPCGSTEYNEKLKQLHPEEVQQAADQLNAEKNFLFQHGEDERASATFIIPVVFHIIHDYGVENISDAQILDQVAILNRDYAKLNADTAQIVPEFQSIASAMDIEFRLATIDPDGNCTNGIDRIASKKTNNGDDGSKLNPWPRRSYLNVWVVKSIGSFGVAGYAYYPSSVVGLGASVDGILILNNYIGSIGTSSVGTSRALTHEVGHWLDLAHPWGSNNSPGQVCGDDGIPDTPQTKGWSYCPSANASKICDTAVVENYQNYMDYSYCSRMFTYYQKLAMHAALISNVSDRNHLSQTSNLIETGTYVIAASNCAPKADFHAGYTMVCEGGGVMFYDNSWNGTVTSRTWTFDGGTPSTSTAANPTIVYNTAGQYNVSLTVSNANGTNTITKYGYIIVGSSYGEVTPPVSEGFENPNVLSNGWYVVNHGQDPIYWHQTNAAGCTGTSSIVLDNYNNITGEVDDLFSPLYDLRYMTGMQMTFKVAFATSVQDTGLITEKLRVLASTNCGQSWTQIATKKATTFVSAGLDPGYFIPSNDPQLWRLITINIGSTYAQSRVRFKFEWTGGRYGNQFYMDDLNIIGTGVGMQEASTSTFIDLFPNPAQENTNVQLSLTENKHVKVTLTDLNGRVIQQVSDQDYGSGQHTIPVSTAELASGMYLITVDDGTMKQVRKLSVHH